VYHCGGVTFRGTERFSIVRKLGEGGFGIVYEVFDRVREEHVALKTLARLDAAAIYRFKREFRLLSDVSHPHLVQLFELFSEQDQWFFTMELVRGVDLISHVCGVKPDAMAKTLAADDVPPVDNARTSQTTLDFDRLRMCCSQLVEGLAAMHAVGVIHRDVKPSNVIVDSRGRTVLLDFGIARDLQRENSETHGGIVGTPAYMAPEQAAGQPVTPAVDWYALGVIMFEALTGHVPFRGAAMQVLLEKQTAVPPRVRTLVPNVPADLDELVRDLLQIEPASRPSGEAILERLGSVPQSVRGPTTVTNPSLTTSRLVGREAQLGEFESAFQTIRDGGSARVLVEGTSGMGKSALVDRFLQTRALRGDAVALAGRCYQRESVPYKAFDGVIDALVRHLLSLPATDAAEIAPRDGAALATVFRVLERVPSIARAPRRNIADAHTLRARAFDALRELLTRMTDRKPLIIFIDDMQWGDADSVALLGRLTAPPDPPAVMWIIGYRADESERSPALTALLPAWRRDARTVVVDALSESDAETLARNLLGSDPTVHGVTTEIARESGGNPFFVGELVRYFQTASLRASSRVVRLDRVIRDRVASLPEAAARLLELVCIAGRPVARDVALRAAALSGTEARTMLAQLTVTHLIRRTTLRAIEGVEAFHDRIREGVVAMLDEATTAAHHAAIATALEEAGDPDVEARYAHYLGAGRRADAANCAIEIAGNADDALAFARSAQFWRLAVDLLDNDDPRRRELLGHLGDALANAGRSAEAADVFLAAAELSPGSHQLELQRRAAEQLLFAGHIDAGARVIATVLERVGLRLSASPARALLTLVFLRVFLLLRGLRFRIHDETEVSPQQLTHIDVCWSVSAGLALVNTIQAVGFATRGLLLALRAGEPKRLCRALAVNASFVGSEGPPGRARAMRFLHLARDLHRRFPDESNGPLVAVGEGWVSFFCGDWPGARKGFAEALEMAGRGARRVQWFADTSQFYYVRSLGQLGQLREAAQRHEMYLREARERGDLYLTTNLNVGTNFVWLTRDDPERALAVVDEAMGQWSHRNIQLQHWYELNARAQRDLYLRRGDDAVARINAQWEQLRRAMIFRVMCSYVDALYLRARAHVAAASSSADHDHLAAALADTRKLERLPFATGNALAALVRGCAAHRGGNDDAAIVELRAAVRELDQLAMSSHAAAARVRLGALLAGDEGRDLRAQGLGVLRDSSVVAPERIVDMYAPGFGEETG
jgi:eukaryotic-like serine/threonine-protein kinase